MITSSLDNYSRIWATLITNSNYLPGVLTLNYSLMKHNSKYPLVALYTDQLDQESLQVLFENNIPSLRIENLNPKSNNHIKFDKRFLDTWSKLYFFKLTQFERIIQLDSDMLILKNMDELMTLPLQNYKFASTHACVCNPLRFDHYPDNWIPSNCAFTNHHNNNPRETIGPPSTVGLSKCNSGILIVEPSLSLFNEIFERLNDQDKIKNYMFPDQDLLADLFYHNWLAISYKYNCLKTFKQHHPHLWDLSEIKNIHFILSPKPWDVDPNTYVDDSKTFKLWWDMNNERLQSS